MDIAHQYFKKNYELQAQLRNKLDLLDLESQIELENMAYLDDVYNQDKLLFNEYEKILIDEKLI